MVRRETQKTRETIHWIVSRGKQSLGYKHF